MSYFVLLVSRLREALRWGCTQSERPDNRGKVFSGPDNDISKCTPLEIVRKFPLCNSAAHAGPVRLEKFGRIWRNM